MLYIWAISRRPELVLLAAADVTVHDMFTAYAVRQRSAANWTPEQYWPQHLSLAALQRQTAATDYFSSDQLLLLVFAQQWGYVMGTSEAQTIVIYYIFLELKLNWSARLSC